MLNLIRLARMTANGELEQKADRIGRAFALDLERGPMGMTQMLQAVEFAIGPSHEVVIVGEESQEDTKAMLAALRSIFLPDKVVLFRPMHIADPVIAQIASFTAAQKSIDGKATAYVCRNYACQLPTTDPEKMLELLRTS